MRQLLAYIDQPNFPPRYNIAPTQPVAAVIRADSGERRFMLMRWGFLPSWVRNPKDFPLVFNIRSESAAEKPAFRNALRRRRALMPADAFYEWRKLGKDSLPYMIRRRDRRAFAFAALWETFSSDDGSEIDTVAILTTAAAHPFTAIHPRSPIILPDASIGDWLAPDAPADAIAACMTPAQPDLFEAVRIGPAINKVANDDASVQIPVEESEAPPPLKAPPPRRAPREKADDDDGQGSLF